MCVKFVSSRARLAPESGASCGAGFPALEAGSGLGRPLHPSLVMKGFPGSSPGVGFSADRHSRLPKASHDHAKVAERSHAPHRSAPRQSASVRPPARQRVPVDIQTDFRRVAGLSRHLHDAAPLRDQQADVAVAQVVRPCYVAHASLTTAGAKTRRRQLRQSGSRQGLPSVRGNTSASSAGRPGRIRHALRSARSGANRRTDLVVFVFVGFISPNARERSTRIVRSPMSFQTEGWAWLDALNREERDEVRGIIARRKPEPAPKRAERYHPPADGGRATRAPRPDEPYAERDGARPPRQSGARRRSLDRAGRSRRSAG